MNNFNKAFDNNFMTVLGFEPGPIRSQCRIAIASLHLDLMGPGLERHIPS